MTPPYQKRTHPTTHLVVHCAQTNADEDFDVEDVREWHTLKPPKGNGWIDVGYHGVIKRDGTFEQGRPWWAVGSHVKDWNHCSEGICLIGGCDKEGNEENNFTDAQWATLERVLRERLEVHPKAQVLGHRDFPDVDKYCPSFDVKPWWEGLNETPEIRPFRC